MKWKVHADIEGHELPAPGRRRAAPAGAYYTLGAAFVTSFFGAIILYFVVLLRVCPPVIATIRLAVSVQRRCTGLNIETAIRLCSLYSVSDKPACSPDSYLSRFLDRETLLSRVFF